MTPTRQLLEQIGDALRKNRVPFDPHRIRNEKPGVAVAAPITVREALDAIRKEIVSGQLSDVEMVMLLNEIEVIVAYILAEHRRRRDEAVDILSHERLNA